MLVAMSERVITVNGREMRVGTVEDAARLCVSVMAPNGVSEHTYRNRHEKNLGAPGPILVPDPWPEIGAEPGLVILRDPDGNELRDLDAVREWNAARPGPGNRTDRTAIETMLRTSARVAVLEDAAHGRLMVDPQHPDDYELSLLMATPHGTNRERETARRAARQLRMAGAFTDPDPDGRLKLSAAGVRLRTRYTQ